MHTGGSTFVDLASSQRARMHAPAACSIQCNSPLPAGGYQAYHERPSTVCLYMHTSLPVSRQCICLVRHHRFHVRSELRAAMQDAPSPAQVAMHSPYLQYTPGSSGMRQRNTAIKQDACNRNASNSTRSTSQTTTVINKQMTYMAYSTIGISWGALGQLRSRDLTTLSDVNKQKLGRQVDDHLRPSFLHSLHSSRHP